MTPSLRQRVLTGDPLIGTFCAIPHPAATEMVAHSGFDFLCLDAEHAAIDRGTAENMLRAASAANTPALIRVAGNTPELIGGALDSGAAGILVPRINSPEEAQDVVQAVRYPPVGSRGAGPGRAATYGGSLGKYIGHANDDLLLAVQIETVEAVRNAAEIAAVEGVDMVFIGPGDLSVSLGAFDDTDNNTTQLNQTITSVLDAAKQHSQNIGIFRPSSEDVAEWSKLGVSLFILNSESIMMMTASAQTAAAARAQLKDSIP